MVSLDKLSAAQRMADLTKEAIRDQNQYQEIVDEFHDWSHQMGELEDVKKSEFDKLNEKANNFFKEHKFLQAVELYKKALTLDEYSVKVYSNLAACYLELKEYIKVIKVCSLALTIEDDVLKLLYRRALAYFHLDQFLKSEKDLVRILRVHGPIIMVESLLKEIYLKYENDSALYIPPYTKNLNNNKQNDEIENKISIPLKNIAEIDENLSMDDEYDLNDNNNHQNSTDVSIHQHSQFNNDQNESQTYKILKLTPKNILSHILSIEDLHNIPREIFEFVVYNLSPEDIESSFSANFDSNLLMRLIAIVQSFLSLSNCEESLQFLINLRFLQRFNLVLNLLKAENPLILDVLHLKLELLKVDLMPNIYRAICELYF